MKKILLTFVILLIAGIFLLGCAKKVEISDEELAAEMEDLPEEKLDAIIAEGEIEENKAVAGQATGFNKPTKVGKLTVSLKKAKEIATIVKLKKEAAKTENCVDGIDNEGNGLIDCADIQRCYSSEHSPKNICPGKEGLDERKILIIGENLGYNQKEAVKSDLEKGIYESGTKACMATFNVGCVNIEVYQNEQWAIESQIACDDIINENKYNFDRFYRAVCIGSIEITPPTPPVPAGSEVLTK